MSSWGLRCAITLLLTLATPLTTSSQSLPPSTNDRQSITYLEYELTQPGVTSQQRQVILKQISQLEYQINTRPLITPPGPESTPAIIPDNGRLPAMRATAPPIPTEPSNYNTSACDADRGMITYLEAKLQDPTISYQERVYIPQQINDLKTDIRNRHC